MNNRPAAIRNRAVYDPRMNTLIDALAGPAEASPARDRRARAQGAAAEPSFASQVLVFYPYPQAAADPAARAALEARNRQVQPGNPGAGTRKRSQRED